MFLALLLTTAQVDMPSADGMPAYNCSRAENTVEMPTEDSTDPQVLAYTRSPQSLDWFDALLFPWVTCALNNIYVGQSASLQVVRSRREIAEEAVRGCQAAQPFYADEWSVRALADDTTVSKREMFVAARMAELLAPMIRPDPVYEGRRQ